MTTTAPAPAGGGRTRRQLWLALVVVNALIVLAIFAIMEIALVVMLNHPPPILTIRRLLASYYTSHDRVVIQLLPECAHYDGELGYTLRPGSCRFKNRGFDTRVDVNTAGLRDDEASLASPEVIVLGDSHAMGWGVEGAEAFAQQLEQVCGMKVLNAAISSYGTAREMRMLHRLDRRAVKWVIVQYSDNDARENREFKERKNKLAPMSAENYAQLQERVARNNAYWPGKHVFRFIPYSSSRVLDRVKSSDSAEPDPGATGVTGATGQNNEATAFLHALKSAPDLPAAVRFIVFEINGNGRNDGVFGKALQTQIAGDDDKPDWPVMVLDVASELGTDHFLPLDEHMSAQGHGAVSSQLAKAMGCQVSATSSITPRH